MTYEPTTWEDEAPAEPELRYRLVGSDGNTLYDGVKILLITSVTPGTPVNAYRLNKIEQGIATAQNTADDATDAAEAAQSTATSAASAASAAQASADSAASAASAAQATANSAVGAAANAQSTANSAASVASAAATSADARVPKAAYTGKGVIISGTGVGTYSGVAAGANKKVPMYDSSQASGFRAGIVIPTKGYVSAGSEVTTTSTSYSDALSTTVELFETGRITVRAYCRLRGSALYAAPTVKLVIDGTDDMEAGFQLNTSPADTSWRMMMMEGIKTGVTTGTKTVKVQLKNADSNGGTVYFAAGSKIVIEVDYP